MPTVAKRVHQGPTARQSPTHHGGVFITFEGIEGSGKSTQCRALEKGAVVLCDRFADSTLAYQGYGRGLNISTLKRFNRFATQGLTPDMTFLFDLPVRCGLARRRQDPNQNRIDKEALAFHSRVRQGFLELARQHPRRMTLVNAHRSEEAISKDIRKMVEAVINRRRKSQQILLT